MSESSSIKLIQRLYPYDYSCILIPIRFKTSFQLLYLLVSLNIIFFLIVYPRLILITPPFKPTLLPKNISQNHEQSLSICYIPSFDPWDQTIANSLRIKPVYRCSTNRKNLINVINSSQLIINEIVNKTYYANLITHCVYFKINRNPEEKYFRDWSYSLSEPILILNGRTHPIVDADFVLTRCYRDRRGFFYGEKFW